MKSGDLAKLNLKNVVIDDFYDNKVIPLEVLQYISAIVISGSEFLFKPDRFSSTGS